jgi:hypothetical protein
VANGQIDDPGGVVVLTGPPPVNPAHAIASLQTLLSSMNIHHGATTSLDQQLRQAQEAVKSGRTSKACNSLATFVSGVEAHSDRKLTAVQANNLTAAARQIGTTLACHS